MNQAPRTPRPILEGPGTEKGPTVDERLERLDSVARDLREAVSALNGRFASAMRPGPDPFAPTPSLAKDPNGICPLAVRINNIECGIREVRDALTDFMQRCDL